MLLEKQDQLLGFVDHPHVSVLSRAPPHPCGLQGSNEVVARGCYKDPYCGWLRNPLHPRNTQECGVPNSKNMTQTSGFHFATVRSLISVLQLGPPVERLEQGYVSSVIYFSMGTSPAPKKG